MMRSSTFATFVTSLVCGSWSLAITVSAQEPKKSKAPTASEQRIVITDEAPAAASSQARVVRLDAVPRGRTPMALDASGTRRGPDEPRMITGSFIPQRVDVYGNSTTAAVNLRLYTPSDLNTNGNSKGFLGSGARVDSYSEKVQRIGSNYVLDLRQVAPERRLETATSLLGSERGRQFVAEFDRWQAAQAKRLATR